MLTIYRRHLKSCRHETRKQRKCQCPIWTQGTLGGTFMRKSLGVRSWETAQGIVRDWEADVALGKKQVEARGRVQTKTAVETFLGDVVARGLRKATEKKYRVLLEKQLLPFERTKGMVFLDEWGVEEVRRFRGTWKDAELSAYKKLERLKSFFSFCLDAGYIEENPVKKVKPPKVRPTKIRVFAPEDMEKILWACDLYDTRGIYGQGNRARVKAFVIMLRYSGLRIGDVVSLERERVKDGRIFLHAAKNGAPIFLPLPPVVLDALKEIPDLGRYFFWSGNGELRSCVSDWQRSLRKLFDLAGVKGNPHMFRHSLATELLTKGVPLETVAAILGNSPRIVERHYSHFVQAWQTQIEDTIRKVWS